MGMFDYVNFKTKCPCCGAALEDFQTKSGDRCLETVEPYTVSNFYESCQKCNSWIEYELKKEFGWPAISGVVGSAQDLISSMEDFLNKPFDEEAKNQILESLDKSIFKKFQNWQDYYIVKINTPEAE